MGAWWHQCYHNGSAYFRDVWNLLDAFNVCIMMSVLGIRIVIWYDGIDSTHAMPSGALMSASVSVGRLGLEAQQIDYLMQVIATDGP